MGGRDYLLQDLFFFTPKDSTDSIDLKDNNNRSPSGGDTNTCFNGLKELLHRLTKEVNCKERTTCTNSSEVKPDLCQDQDQQCSIKYKSK